MDITPIPTADGAYSQATVGGQTAWQNTGNSRYLYGRRPNSFAFTLGQTLYVRVTCFDDAGGTVDLQFDAQTSNSKTSTLTTRTTRVNSGRFFDGFFELSDVRFNKSLNGSDFRIVCGTTDGAKVPVLRITISDTPTANANLKTGLTKTGATTQILSGASSYSGPTGVTGGVLTLTGSLGNTSALIIGTGATFENLGSLTASGNITSDGTQLITGAALLAVGGTFTNNGLLDIRGWSGSLPNGLVNNGTILSDPTPTLDPAVFSDWQALVWPGTSDPAVIGPDADPDGDGRKNSLEWALLLDPKVPEIFTPTFSLSAGALETTYTRRKIAPGEGCYQVVWSDTLAGDWSDADVITDLPVSLSDTAESVRSTLSAGAGGRRFLRVRFVRP